MMIQPRTRYWVVLSWVFWVDSVLFSSWGGGIKPRGRPKTIRWGPWEKMCTELLWMWWEERKRDYEKKLYKILSLNSGIKLTVLPVCSLWVEHSGICLYCTWAKVCVCVHHKLLLSGNSASYLADNYRLVADACERRLCSTESRTCVVTQTHSTFGDRTFAAAGRGLWNSLPHISEMLTYRTVGSGGH